MQERSPAIELLLGCAKVDDLDPIQELSQTQLLVVPEVFRKP